MRPQTAIALVLGATLGVVGTWFALQRETTVVVTAGSLPTRIRPDGAQLKEKVSDSLKFDGAVKVVSGSGFQSRNDDAASSSEFHANHLEITQSSGTLQRNQAFHDSSSAHLSSTVEDQIVDPGEDGAYSKFRRVDNIVVRTDYSAADIRLQSITYRIGSSGRLTSYEVLGGDRNKLYRATLGYSQREGSTFGKLIVEKIYDALEPRYFDKLNASGEREERPIYQFSYTYNADGSANEPVGLNMLKVVKNDALFDFGGVEHMVINYGKLAPHIVSALNKSYPIEPPIKP